MKITIISVGQAKNRNFTEEGKEILKRLGPFAKFKFVTVKESTVSKTFTADMVREEEGSRILRLFGQGKSCNSGTDFFKGGGKFGSNNFVVALDELGKEFTSVDFGEFLGKNRDLGIEVVFIIGGAFGLSEDIKASCNQKIALSKMTFTHEMTMVILLEQIYRGFCIIGGREYHIA